MTILTSLLVGFWDSSSEILSWHTLFVTLAVIGAIYIIAILIKRLSGEAILHLLIVAFVVFLIYWIPTLFTDKKDIGTTDKSPNNEKYDNRKLHNSFSQTGPSSGKKTTTPTVSQFEKVTFQEKRLLRKDTTYRIKLDKGGFAIISQNMEEELSLMFRNEKTGKRFSTTTMRNQYCISYKLGYEMREAPSQGIYLFTPKKDIMCSIKALSSITRCQ